MSWFKRQLPARLSTVRRTVSIGAPMLTAAIAADIFMTAVRPDAESHWNSRHGIHPEQMPGRIHTHNNDVSPNPTTRDADLIYRLQACCHVEQNAGTPETCPSDRPTFTKTVDVDHGVARIAEKSGDLSILCAPAEDEMYAKYEDSFLETNPSSGSPGDPNWRNAGPANCHQPSNSLIRSIQ